MAWIRIHTGGRLVVVGRYADVTPRSHLPDGLFEPEPYRPPARAVGGRE